MPNDVFTGGASSSTPNDWSSANWDADNPPTATDTVEQTGAATIDSGSYAIGGLQLDTGADLAIGSGHSLNVSGSTDNVFGGAGTTIEVGGDLTVGSAVTSANGTVTVDAEGHYTYDGSGSTQSVTINPLGEFDLTGSNNDESITTSAASTLVISGPSEGGVLNLASGGTVFMASQYDPQHGRQFGHLQLQHLVRARLRNPHIRFLDPGFHPQHRSGFRRRRVRHFRSGPDRHPHWGHGRQHGRVRHVDRLVGRFADAWRCDRNQWRGRARFDDERRLN
ncbi:MAG: hypothetical protein ABSD80_17795 [Caulobacteraceae bacterium]